MRMGGRRPGRGRDAGGIVTGWLLKIVLVFAIVGVVAFDAVAITYAKVTASDDAHSIAQVASDAVILERASPQQALALAMERAKQRGVVLGPKDIVVRSNGAVMVHVHRVADTVVVSHIGPLVKFTVIDETYETPPK